MYNIICRDDAISQGMFRYFTNMPCKHGHISQRYVSNSGCVECLHVKNGSKLFKNKRKDEYVVLGETYKKHLLWRAKKRAEQKNIEFNLEISDILIPSVCPVFGFEFETGVGKGPSDKSPSIDRIDPKLGYIKTNIQIISFKANKIKNDCSLDDIEKVFLYMKSLES